MRAVRLLAALWLALSAACPAQAAPKVWGYLGWWMPDAWRALPLQEIDRLQFFELKVNARGEIAERNGWPEKWGELQSAAAQHGTPIDLTLTLLDAATFGAVFASSEARQTLLEQTLILAGGEGVAGLQLDFEVYGALGPELIGSYRKFVAELTDALRQFPEPRNLSVFVPVGAETQLYDAATLARVDQVVLQGYDAHWIESKVAGPVAPLSGKDALTWEKAVAMGVALGVPKPRLFLSFPLYGYEWQVKGRKPRGATVGKGVHTSFVPLPAALSQDFPVNVQERVRQYGAAHDPVSGSSYYRFKNKSGKFVEGWFEDWWTLGRKHDYLSEQGLGGLAFFVLGYDGGHLVDYYLARRSRAERQSSEGAPQQDQNGG